MLESKTVATTPTEITPSVSQFCQQLVPGAEPVWVPVRPTPGAAQRDCYPTVDRHVERHGGERVLGWAIWERPGIYLEGEFHAAWRGPDGELVDLTPKDQPTERILFLPAPDSTYEGFVVKNEMLPLCDAIPVLEFMRACDAVYEFENQGERRGLYRLELEGAEVTQYEALMLRKGYWNERIDHGDAVDERLDFRSIARRLELGRNDPCWCGSGRKLKKCHVP